MMHLFRNDATVAGGAAADETSFDKVLTSLRLIGSASWRSATSHGALAIRWRPLGSRLSSARFGVFSHLTQGG
jgi:hypothetical protein